MLPQQVEKAIKTRKAKLVLLAPNIGSIVADHAAAASAADGSDGAEPGAGSMAAGGVGGAAKGEYPAQALIALAAEKDVPLVFALSRQRMGKVGTGSRPWHGHPRQCQRRWSAKRRCPSMEFAKRGRDLQKGLLPSHIGCSSSCSRPES